MRTVLITGGSEGIGLACGKKLFDLGYVVCLLSRSQEKLSLAEREIAGGTYSASKYAANALIETLIQECRGSNIRISSISPDPVSTNIWSHKIIPPSKEEQKRMLRPEDIADIASFLISTPENVHIRDIEVTPWKF